MIPSLRRRHRLIWILWAILLPLGFVLAIASIPRPVYHPTDTQQAEAYPEVIVKQESESISASLREDQGLKQIELNLKKAYIAPSTYVYLSKESFESPDQAQLLGALTSPGTYRFNLDSASSASEYGSITLFDPIHNQILDSFNF